MKYSENQFKVLVKSIAILDKHNGYFNILNIGYLNLHYLVYQQFNTGQKHNWLYINDNGEIRRAHGIANFEGWQKLIDIDFDFKLYPDGCNDSHVETATKRALLNIINHPVLA